MSMPFLTFSCSKCDFSGSSTVNWGRFSYESSKGLVPINRELGWCHSCKILSPVEILPSAERLVAIENELNAVKKLLEEEQKKRPWIFKMIGFKRPSDADADLEFTVTRLKDEFIEEQCRHTLLSSRKTKPICLRCGSDDVFGLLQKIEPTRESQYQPARVPIGVKHPKCGGDLLALSPRIRLQIILTHRVYDLEGQFIRIEDTM